MNREALALNSVSDDALLARVADLVARSRRVEADLIWHLAEVDARRLYLREACPSMHAYATERLHLSDAEAYLRITVARLSRRFPLVLTMLADGRLHLSGIARLAPHMRDVDGEALLGRAAFRSKREIEMLVAELAPGADLPSRMRKLPTPASSGRTGPIGAGELVPGGAAAGEAGSQPELVPGGDAAGEGRDRAVVAPPPPAAKPAVMVPVAPSRFKVQFTAGAELHDKIICAQALLRRQIPDGDLAEIFDRAMTVLLRQLEQAKFAATPAPRKTAAEADPTPASRRIPDPIRRAVWERDGGQCTFRDRQGRRCPARDRLEFHHVEPFGQGGDHSQTNLRLACAGHDSFQADLDYGAAFMAARRRSDAPRPSG